MIAQTRAAQFRKQCTKKVERPCEQGKDFDLRLLLIRLKIYTRSQQEEGINLDGATGVTIKSDLERQVTADLA